MAESHVVTALIRKRAEIAGQIEHAQTQLRQIIIDLDNLDATLRLFKPDINSKEIRPRAVAIRHAVFRGELFRLVLDTLRQSTVPLTTLDLAEHLMAQRGLNTADKRLVRLTRKRIGAALRHQRDKGLVRSEYGPGQHLVWRTAS